MSKPKAPVGSKVFVVVLISKKMIVGCFNERVKAEKYTNGSDEFAIEELTIA